MKIKLTVLALVGVLLYMIDSQFHFVSDRVVQIKDIHHKQTIHLFKKEGEGHIVGLAIHIYGNIEGTAKLSLNKQEEIVTGNIELKRGGDWYSDSIDIVYEPIGEVGSGKLEIAYDFEGI